MFTGSLTYYKTHSVVVNIKMRGSSQTEFLILYEKRKAERRYLSRVVAMKFVENVLSICIKFPLFVSQRWLISSIREYMKKKGLGSLPSFSRGDFRLLNISSFFLQLD